MRKQQVIKSVKNNVFEFRKTLATLIISAFGFVAAFVWRDVIKAFFEEVLGLTWGSDFYGTLIVAVVLTIVLVVISILLSRYASK